jgi:multiple sugar transport system ATP-binding protein
MSDSLTITNIVKSYGKKIVINELSFSAEASEFIVLVGPSGCGKSTVLRCVAGLEPIDSGSILIGDREVSGLPPKDRDIAMVFQDYALYPHKNVYENIAFGLRIRRESESEIDRKVKLASEKLNLTPFLHRKPGALSGGQRQRVAIGRCIVRDPKVFLFDEPLSNLDAKLRGSMRQTISRLHHELKKTAIYVTHDQVEAMTLADRIIVLDGGKIRQVGTPLDLYYRPSNVFVATFIGSPSMNIIDGSIVDKGEHVFFVSDLGMEIQIPDAYVAKVRANVKAGQKVLWGVRPDNLKYRTEDKVTPNGFTAEVIVSEPLGPTTTVLSCVAGHEMNIALPEPYRPKAKEKVPIYFSSKHFYLFDQKTEESLV